MTKHHWPRLRIAETAHEIPTARAGVDRLNVMREVAFTKFKAGLPVDDPAREQQAADAFVTAAAPRGVARSVAEPAIRAQFEAGKDVQRRLIRGWAAGTLPIPDKQPADLVWDLRPKIDAATSALLVAIADARVDGVPANWSTRIHIASWMASPRLVPDVHRENLTTAMSPIASWPRTTS